MDYYLTNTQHFEELFAVGEHYIYGSSRVGSALSDHWLRKYSFKSSYSYLTNTYTQKDSITDSLYKLPLCYRTLTRGLKRYEMSNHLGNVLAVVSDQWRTSCYQIPYISGPDTTYFSVLANYEATTVQATEYSPFGAPLPGRTWVMDGITKARHGFNGEMLESDMYEGGYDLGERFFDSRTARMFKLDPLMQKYPWQSPYAYCGNSPISLIDEKGMGNGRPVKTNESVGAYANDVYKGEPGSMWDKLDKMASLDNGENGRFKGYDSKWTLERKQQYWNNNEGDWMSRFNPEDQPAITSKEQDQVAINAWMKLADPSLVNKGEPSKDGLHAATPRFSDEHPTLYAILNPLYVGVQAPFLGAWTSNMDGIRTTSTERTDGFVSAVATFFPYTASSRYVSGAVSQGIFKSSTLGVASSKLGNSFVRGTPGAWNVPGTFIKFGWSSTGKGVGGMQLRIGIGNAGKNVAAVHFYIPGTFVENNVANPIMKSLKP